MSGFVVVKAGTTFPNTARQYGDCEDWTCRGLGMARDRVRVIDALRIASLPAAETCAGVVVTGSHAMVSVAHDWSERLVEWIAGLVDARVPYLGICFGHQLLARAAGGRVDYHPLGKETGTVDIALLPASATDRLLQGLRARFPVHVTHAQTVRALPATATRLASKAFEHCHALRVGECAWGLQFHPEYDSGIMTSCIDEQAGELGRAGMDPAAIRRSVRVTTDAARILRRAGLCAHAGGRGRANRVDAPASDYYFC